MISMIKDAFYGIIGAVFVYQSIVSGLQEDYIKGAYYLLWTLVTIEVVMLDTDLPDLSDYDERE